MKRAVLITGGAGYIGSHCCSVLADAGYLPVSYDNLTTGHREFVKWGPLVVGDVRDHGALRQAMVDYDVCAVMHFAAASLVGESVLDPQKYYVNNVVGSATVLQAMRDAGLAHLVFSSTGAVYGDAKGATLSEDLACEPINPYGRSKLTVERMLTDYRLAYGFSSFSLRYFNACGARRGAGIGEKRAVETHLIPRALSALTNDLDEFSIYGTDYDTPDGTAIRDYIYVVDLAHAHLKALELLLAGHTGDCCNLGTGRGYSVAEVLWTIRHVTGRSVPHTEKPRRPGDPPVLVADNARAKRVLAFTPSHSALESIIETSWNWHAAELV
jgi:UDP-glucose-4-epimerase GalE